MLYALIITDKDPDGNLLDDVIGIYDSEEKVPNEYKTHPRTSISSKNDLKSGEFIYYGICSKIPEGDWDFFDFDWTSYMFVRLQEIEINKRIHFLYEDE